MAFGTLHAINVEISNCQSLCFLRRRLEEEKRAQEAASRWRQILL